MTGALGRRPTARRAISTGGVVRKEGAKLAFFLQLKVTNAAKPELRSATASPLKGKRG